MLGHLVGGRVVEGCGFRRVLQHIGFGGAGGGGQHPQGGLQGLLHGCTAQKLDEFACGFGLPAALDQCHAFHLLEHPALERQADGGRFAQLDFAVKHLCRRAAGIADHQRALAPVFAEVGVVGLGPAFGHFHAVAAHLGPPVKGGIVAHGGHGRCQKRHAGAGRGRVLHHQQVFIGWQSQVLQRGGQRKAFFGKPDLVGIQRDVAKVHWHQRGWQAGG